MFEPFGLSHAFFFLGNLRSNYWQKNKGQRHDWEFYLITIRNPVICSTGAPFHDSLSIHVYLFYLIGKKNTVPLNQCYFEAFLIRF